MLTTYLAAHRPVGQMRVSAVGRFSDRGKPTIDIVGVAALSGRSTEPNEGARFTTERPA